MMKLLALLRALKIFDADNTLSLSNIAFMVILFRIATAATLPWVEVLTFMAILLNHNARKHFAKSRADAKASSDEAVKQLQQKMTNIESSLELFNKTRF